MSGDDPLVSGAAPDMLGFAEAVTEAALRRVRAAVADRVSLARDVGSARAHGARVVSRTPARGTRGPAAVLLAAVPVPSSPRRRGARGR